MDDPIIRATGTTTQYFHQDGLGNVVSVTNQSGTTDGTARYDAWGDKIASTGTIPQYGFTGREPDDTGLVYYRARFYDPSIGRFTQRDPIGLIGGLNFYSYVGNDPTNLTDPEGLLCPTCFIGAAIGGVGELATQYATAKFSGQNFSPNWTKVAIAAGAGFVGAGILKSVGNIVTGYTALAQATRVGASTITEVGLGIAQTALKGENITTSKVLAYGLGGFGAGMAGEVAAKIALGSTSPFIQRQADRFQRIADNRLEIENRSATTAMNNLEKALKEAFDPAEIRAAVAGGAAASTIERGTDVFESVLGRQIQPSIGSIDKGIQGSANVAPVVPFLNSSPTGGLSNSSFDK